MVPSPSMRNPFGLVRPRPLGAIASCALPLLFAMCGGQKTTAAPTPVPTPTPTPAPAGPWQLTWSDEFDGPDGSRPDQSRWVAETGGNGWGNEELESYTNRPENAHIENGNLIITARAEAYTGSDGHARGYTSARLKTQGQFAQTYGRFEVRMQIPRGQGLWPAFWMLGADISSVGWPASGEIDIMENIGREPNIVHGTIHGPGFSGAASLGLQTSTADGRPLADGYHVYAVEWEPAEIRWYLDDRLYETRKATDLPAGARWVFDHDFFILLNVAVGGSWPGSPDGSTVFPQEMKVDYVRVYRR